MRHLLAFALALAACGAPVATPPTVTSPDAASGSDVLLVDASAAPPDVASPDGAPPDDAHQGYPAGPYGSAVGQVVADLAWEGYVNDAHERVSTELPFGPTSMGAVRATGAPFALVHLSGFL